MFSDSCLVDFILFDVRFQSDIDTAEDDVNAANDDLDLTTTVVEAFIRRPEDLKIQC
ncbi:hypothetical protein YC2023_094257 [Brassica napus]